MKVAIVHDFLNQYGGAERVLDALHEAFPDAPIFTSIFLPDNFPPRFASWDIRTSFMQRLPWLRSHFKTYLPLYPLAFAQVDVRGFDIILSSSSAFAKGVRIPKGARHLCYCYTPMRFVWDRDKYLRNEPMPKVIKPLLAVLLAALKQWDLYTSRRVDLFVAISAHIQQRIGRAYGVGSEIIYPPAEVESIQPGGQPGDYYLVVSRLTPYKQIELAIQACEALGRPLKVVGKGPHEGALRRLAGSHTQFLGGVSFDELKGLLAGARAFIFPGEEDFGIAPVEAMAAGRPVIALGSGGALETVVDGQTGILFPEPSVASLMGAIQQFETRSFDAQQIRRQAERFSRGAFVQRIRARVEQLAAGRDPDVPPG